MTQQNRIAHGDSSLGRHLAFTRAGVVAALLLTGGWMPLALAIDPPPPAKAPAAATKPADKPAAEKPAADKPATEKPAAEKAAAEAAKPEADDEEIKPPPPPKTPGKSTGSAQRFEPSEQVRPDFDVSFPIDI